jgi:predicted pyridoxine 5'-phosphate oxidase superfamily flavin-nucleotide-binding protein
MFDNEIKKYIDKSVLCWLATSDNDNFPNVSPKEMFTYLGENKLLIANIASPNSVKNIMQNNKVCVSFVDVFVQKGYKIKGEAVFINKEHLDFEHKKRVLTNIYSDNFPINGIIEIEIKKIETIKAPSYFLFPGITEQQQIEGAMKTYKVIKQQQ